MSGCTRRVARGVLMAAGIIAVLAVAAHVTLGAVYKRRYSAQLDRMRAEGIPMSQAELFGRQVPPSNDASVLVLRALPQRPPEADPEKWEKEALTLIWADAPDEVLVTRARAALAGLEREYRLLLSASSRQQASFSPDEIARLRQTASYERALNLLAAEGVVRQADGDTAGFSASLSACIRLGNLALTGEYLSATQALAPAICGIDVANRLRPLEPGQAALLDAVLSRTDPRADAGSALDREFAFAVETKAHYDRGSSLTRYLSRPYSTALTVALIDLLFDIRKLSHEPWREWPDRLPQAPDFSLLRTQRALADMMQYSYARTFCSMDVAQTEVNAARVALALELHRREHGRYPAALEGLLTPRGEALPPDPFSGKPFVYRPQGKGYRFSSLGPDLDDDKGLPLTGLWSGASGDLVWESGRFRMVRPPAARRSH